MKLPDKYSLVTYDHLDSTNIEAKRLCSIQTIQHLVIWAMNQTHGYGKLKRHWYSGSNNLTFSIILPHTYHPRLVGHFLFIAALSVYHAIKAIFKRNNTNHKIYLKWPNDIMIDGEKLSGILIENLVSKIYHHNMIIGVGINITEKPNEIICCSLSDFVTEKLDISDIMVTIVNHIESYRDKWLLNGFNDIKAEWLAYAYNIGQEIVITTPSKKIQGIFTDINNDGAIIIKMKSGLYHATTIGEIL